MSYKAFPHTIFVHTTGARPELGKQVHQLVGVFTEAGELEVRNIHTQQSHRVPMNKKDNLDLHTATSDINLVQRTSADSWHESHVQALSTIASADSWHENHAKATAESWYKG